MTHREQHLVKDQEAKRKQADHNGTSALICSFCGRTCKTKLALWTHENACGIKDNKLPWKNQTKLNIETDYD